MYDFPKWLKAQRKKYKLTQQEFSELFRIPIGTLRAWEQGSQSPPDYYKFLLKTTFLLKPIGSLRLLAQKISLKEVMMDFHTSAAYLYDGGWRKEDKEQLANEYELSEEKAEAIALELEKIEQEQRSGT